MKPEEILPEYHSKNFLLRNLFLKRLKIAFQLAKPELKPELNVVDLGCGQGLFLKIVEEEFKNIKTFGIDTEPSVLGTKKFLRANIKIADLRKTGFPNSFFDVVFCLDTLEHFKDLEMPVKEIKRILKQGSLLVVSLPTENLFYKIGRLLVKGTISKQKGPSIGSHFHGAKLIEKFLFSKGFKPIKNINLPKILPLFHIVSFRKI